MVPRKLKMTERLQDVPVGQSVGLRSRLGMPSAGRTLPDQAGDKVKTKLTFEGNVNSWAHKTLNHLLLKGNWKLVKSLKSYRKSHSVTS